MKKGMMLMLAAVMFLAVFTLTASAQATRTWVSGVGDDANPCSRTAPCKTFPGAISKTATGGEINCLDPGGFGVVTITKSITIDCTGTLGGILASGTTGVIINGAGAEVKLRALEIDGGTTGVDGIRILNASSVTIENVSIHGFTHDGIEFTPSANTGNPHLAVTNTTVFNTRIGLLVQGGLLLSAAVDGSNFVNNVVGVVASDNSRVTCTGCNASLNTVGFQSQTAGNTISELSLESCISAHNRNGASAAGVSAGGGGAGTSKLRMSNVGLYDNSMGFSIFAGGTISTFGNNRIDGNTANSGALTGIAQQ
jgi:hypothetical protein